MNYTFKKINETKKALLFDSIKNMSHFHIKISKKTTGPLLYVLWSVLTLCQLF